MKIKREVKLAVTVLFAVLILIWGINFLKGSSLFESRTILYGVYDRVDGLKVSSGVMYRGYQVGQVLDISFTGERFDKVLVEFSVKDGLALAKNSYAFIQSADLMGSKVINLIPGDALEMAQDGDTLLARVEQGLMEQVSAQMLPLKQKAERIFGSLDSVLVIVQGLFDDRTKQNLANSFLSIDRTLKHVEGAMGNLDTLLDTEVDRISQILAHVNSVTANLEQNNGSVSRVLSNVAAITDTLRYSNLKQTLASLESSLLEADSILGKINAGKGTVGALLSDQDLYHNLNETTENLNRLLVEFRSNPKKFINLSLIDFSANKSEEEYGIVVFESKDRLKQECELYKEYPNLREIKRHGIYLYVVATFKKREQAQRKLGDVLKRHKNAYIVKIDFI